MLRIGSCFSGYGGLDMGVQMALGGEVAWHVEFDAAPSKILAHHYDVPNYGDVTAVDWASVEPVDVLTGGFPCTDVSHAGKRLGLKPDTRSGLWEHMRYAIDQLRPRLVVIENVRGLLSAEANPAGDYEHCPWCLGGPADGEPAMRALGRVVFDLASIGYVGSWTSVRAADAGAPHGRFRVFVVAHPAANAGRSGGDEAVQHDGRGPAAVNWAGVPDQPDRDADGAGPVGGLAPGWVDGWPDSQPWQGERLLPTPKASDGPNGGPGMRNGRGQADALPGVVSLLPTPSAADGLGGHESRGGARGHERPLPGIAKDLALLPTVRAAQGESRNHTIYVRDAPQQNLENALAFTLTDEGAQTSIDDCGCSAWGPYAPALHRWEQILGRPAPEPTELSAKGRRVLSPRAVEFMMGLPEGHVTALGADPGQTLSEHGTRPLLSRAQQLKALGNGVVPQQAALALRMLLGLGGATVAAGGALLPAPAVNDMGAADV